MDTTSINKPAPLVTGGQPSRLPAGSTLLVNGIHVPHPHAEVNLPGAGDPRLGATNAVTETIVDGVLKSEPLHDAVKPSRLTADPNAPAVDHFAAQPADAAAKSVDLDLKQDPQNKSVEEHN